MIKKSNMDGVRAYSDYEALPKGGYVIEIKKASTEEGSYGQYVDILFDIAEGPYKDYYTNDYHTQTRDPKLWHGRFFLNVPNDDGTEQDGWTKRRFKTFTDALEDSNPGYHFDWNEKGFVGKKIGALMRIEEYEGNDGFVRESVKPGAFTNIQSIHNNRFRLPKDKRLDPSRNTVNRTTEDSDNKFPDITSDDLPF